MKRWIVIVVLALLLGACGHHATSSTTTSTSSAPVNTPAPGHPCPASKFAPGFYMQCAAGAPGQVTRPTAQTGVRSGIDFAWGGPSGAAAASGGYTFGCSYLSGTSKDWNYSAIHSYTGRGSGACAVWETSATRSYYAGWNGGYSDAWSATHELGHLGYGKGVDIFLASDYDTTPYGDRFVSYYQGAAAWAKRAGDIAGGYGGLHTVQRLCAYGIKPDWQTLAWSYGQWASSTCAPLRQTSINNTVTLQGARYSVDHDVALAPDYGQINYVAPPPPVVCFGKHATPRSAKCKPIVADVAKWRRAVTESDGAYRARGCPKLVSARGALTRRWNWFWLALRQHPKVKHAYREGALATTARALNSVRRTITGRGCVTFSNTAGYYAKLIATTERKHT